MTDDPIIYTTYGGALRELIEKYKIDGLYMSDLYTLKWLVHTLDASDDIPDTLLVELELLPRVTYRGQ
jgi:hypothetical protein